MEQELDYMLLDIGDTNPTPNPDGGGQESPSEEDAPVLSTFYELLTKEGLISAPEGFEFDGSLDKFKEVTTKHFEALQAKAREEILTTLPEQNRLLVEAALSGVQDLTALVDLSTKNPMTLPASEAAQIMLIEADLKAKGLDEEAIAVLTAKVKKDNKVSVEAQKIVDKNVQSFTKAKKEQEMLAKQEEENQKKAAQQYMTAFDEKLAGYTKDKTRQESIKKLVFESNAVLERIDEMFKNPELMIQVAEFLSYYKDGKIETDAYKGVSSQKVQQQKDAWALAFERSKGKQMFNSASGGDFDVDFSKLDIG